MKTTFRLGVPTLLLSALNSQLLTFAQGSLTPPAGAPAPVMKSLDQIEARTPISFVPFTINKSGSYYLTTNLTVTTGNAISIVANNVALDLGGFTISSTSPTPSGSAIQINNGLNGLSIMNGFIKSGVTNNGSNLFGGSGFVNGIYVLFNTGVDNSRINGVSVFGCLQNGISMPGAVVESCVVNTAGDYGIIGGSIRDSIGIGCGNSGINGETVINCRGASVSYGAGISGYTIDNCRGVSQNFRGVTGYTINNSHGSASAGSYEGVFANTVMNSTGFSSGGTGLYAEMSANNCHGYSTSGIGLSAKVANNCVGQRAGGTAIQATVANGCYAANGTNLITYKYNMP